MNAAEETAARRLAEELGFPMPCACEECKRNDTPLFIIARHLRAAKIEALKQSETDSGKVNARKMAELVDAEKLLSITPNDPLATPLLKQRIEELKSELASETDARVDLKMKAYLGL